MIGVKGLTSLNDNELEALLEQRGLDRGGSDLRGQVAVALLAEAGLSSQIVRTLTTLDAVPGRGVRLDATLPQRVERLLDQVVAGSASGGYVLGVSPLSPEALAKLLARHGARRGVKGVTVQRLRRTYARRAVEQGVPRDVLARRLGVKTKNLQEFLRRDPKVTKSEIPPAE